MSYLILSLSLSLSSSTGHYLLTGAGNGCVRVHRLSTPYTITDISQGQYWYIGMHDSQYGLVSGIAVSYDDQYVVSVGGDSGVFVYKTNFTSVQQSKPNIDIPVRNIY